MNRTYPFFRLYLSLYTLNYNDKKKGYTTHIMRWHRGPTIAAKRTVRPTGVFRRPFIALFELIKSGPGRWWPVLFYAYVRTHTHVGVLVCMCEVSRKPVTNKKPVPMCLLFSFAPTTTNTSKRITYIKLCIHKYIQHCYFSPRFKVKLNVTLFFWEIIKNTFDVIIYQNRNLYADGLDQNISKILFSQRYDGELAITDRFQNVFAFLFVIMHNTCE
jgi:hypothetical protein